MSRRPDEPVRLTKIYTRGGDAGETSLGDGSRVSKLDPLVRAYGAVDELNSLLGWAQVEAARSARSSASRTSSSTSAPTCRCRSPTDDGKLRITQDAIDRLERDCDDANAPLPELRSFVLPGGSEAAARLHVARATCRRAEREALAAGEERELNPLALVYLNRLSDLLFILARAANARRRRAALEARRRAIAR